MLSQLRSMAVSGIDALEVSVEVDISNGVPGTTIVGLPDKSVNESKERVRSAVMNSGFEFPNNRRVTINLAPADVKKEGPSFDLPIALGILAANGVIDLVRLEKFIIAGELSLEGKTRPVTGMLPMAIETKKLKSPWMIVPYKNLAEASLVDNLRIFPVNSLIEAVEVIRNASSDDGCHGEIRAAPGVDPLSDVDFNDVRGHRGAKRALEIAASGNHNILMVGPPGSGKTMLARRLPTILPPMSFDEALEVTKIYSIQGLLIPEKPLVVERPFRSPHHSASYAGLVGGGRFPKPGEISLAHHGVLFLDELPEFRKDVLEMLRQPMEDGKIVLSRARTSLCYPSSFMLVASMNPCPCGYYLDTIKSCGCSYSQIRKYRMRLSGPLLDRIDLHIEVPRLNYSELSAGACDEDSRTIRRRVIHARECQKKRFGTGTVKWNSNMSSRDLREFSALDRESALLLEEAVEKFGLSARAYIRIQRVARTIADLGGRSDVTSSDIAEAIQYRMLDRDEAF